MGIVVVVVVARAHRPNVNVALDHEEALRRKRRKQITSITLLRSMYVHTHQTPAALTEANTTRAQKQ